MNGIFDNSVLNDRQQSMEEAYQLEPEVDLSWTERYEQLAKLRWVPIEARWKQEMLKLSAKDISAALNDGYATQIRAAILEHYREKSDFRWALLRKLADKAVLEKRFKDFTDDKIPIANPDSGPKSEKHIWISKQKKLEIIIEKIISEKSIGLIDDAELREFIDIKQSLGLWRISWTKKT